MTISNLYPALKPSLNLDFANVKALDPRITFARASTGTYYGAEVAKAEENLLTYSQEFDNAVWSKPNLTITANSTTAPDGTTTAENIVPSTGSNAKQLFQAVAVSGGYRVSAFAKANGYNFVALGIGGASNSICWYDLQNGVVGTAQSGATDATITSLGDDWYRCSHFIANSTGGSNFSVFVSPTDNVTTYTGNGTSGIFLWGAQLEQRSAVTAYTPTTTQPITNYIPVLQTASANVARFDHNPVTGESLGLLVEEQRTNLFLNNQLNLFITTGGLDNTQQNGVAPDGTITAYHLIESTDTTSHGTGWQFVYTIGQAYTFSAFIKPDPTVPSDRSITFYGRAELLPGSVTFNFADNSVTGTGTSFGSEEVGNGYYRIWFSAVATGTAVGGSELFTYTQKNGSQTYTATEGQRICFVWGFQLEAGAFPTSYIKTEASQVTRSADSASMTGANFSEWYRQDEGTLYGEYDYFGSNITSNLATFNQASNTQNRWYLLSNNSVGRSQFVMRPNNSVQADIFSSVSAVSVNTMTKAVATYKANDFAISQDSLSVTTDLSGYVTNNIDQMVLGNSGFNNVYLNGHIKKIAFWSKRLSNTELQALTS
jgi:hypothetical protein